jgi:phage FluMu gp28-like protein
MPSLDDDFKYRVKSGENRLAWATHLLAYADDTPFIPDWWQSFYLKADDALLITNKSRRIGWSYITSVKGLVTALDPALSGYTKQFVSYSLDDATEKIRIATEFYDSIPEMARPKKLVSRTRTHLEFLDRNGRSISRLISLPCKQPRGKGGDISLDEYAFHAKDDEIYTASIAVTSRGGSIEIGSTPFGNKGRFYEILTDRNQYGDYKRYNVPWYFSPALCRDVERAIADKEATTDQRVERHGTDKLHTIFRSMPVDDFQQEFECMFRDELAAFITLDMIRSCTPTGDDEIPVYRRLDDFIIAYNPEVHGSLYAGYDVGRTNDKSELTIIGHYPDQNIRTAWCCVSTKGSRFEDQEALLSRALTELPIHRLDIDATGLGMDLGERMVTRFKRKVEACTFTNEFKEDIANALWLAMDGRYLILPADRELQQQIHSIKKIVTSGKHARFDCDNNTKHHADRFWSLALANYAVETAPAKTRGSFYNQLRERQEQGAAKVSNPRVILNRIAAGYQGKR